MYQNTTTTIHSVKSANVNSVTKKGVERLDKGELPGCCHVCPTGAIIFGTREELLAEAKRRLSLLRGTEYDYPRQHVNSTDNTVLPCRHINITSTVKKKVVVHKYLP